MTTFTRCRLTAVAAVLCLAVVGCGGEVAGTTAGPSYTPPDPATATATTVDLGRALGTSQDGTLVAITQDDQFCVRAREPSGTTTTAVCSRNPVLGQLQRAEFSPNGSHVAVFGSDSMGFGAIRAFIVDTKSGSAVQVTLPDEPGAGSNSASPSATGSTTGSGSTGTRPGSDILQFVSWDSENSLVGAGILATVYRVDAASGSATLLAQAGDRRKDGLVMAARGGGSLVLQVVGSGNKSRLVQVSLADGAVRDGVVDPGSGIDRPVLMGVSPDGSKALVSSTDLMRYQPGETAVYDLASGAHTTIAGTGQTFTFAGGFSPDGSLVALVGTDPIADGDTKPKNEYTLRLAPADGSAAPRSIAAADPSSAYGPLVWSTSGWISGPAYSSAGASAWQLGS